MLVLEELGEGGVLGVPVQGDDVLVVAAQLGQRHAVRLPGRHLQGGGHNVQRVSDVVFFFFYPHMYPPFTWTPFTWTSFSRGFHPKRLTDSTLVRIK